MAIVIREVEKPSFRDLFGLAKRQPLEHSETRGKDILSQIQTVGSGKGALTIILKHLCARGIIKNKLDEIMVPDWLGSWVYNQMNPFVFPSKRFSKRTKILFVYHQYGFPQNMDKILAFARKKKLIVVEDCAHALESYYKNRRLGTFGDYALFSFSKWFFCFALGGVKGKPADFKAFVSKELSKVPFGVTFVKDLAKLVSDLGVFSRSEKFCTFSNLFLKMSYGIYGDALKPSRLAQKLLKSKLESEIDIRKKRYQYFRKETDHLGICEHLERDGVTPYVIPIRVSDNKAEKMVDALRKKGIETGVYQFDINRNVLSPRFVPCIWVPCHSGISDGEFEKITRTVLKTYA